MRNCNCDLHSLSTCSLEESGVPISKDHEISRVSQVCRTTVSALSEFSALIQEDARRMEEARPGLEGELETAKARLDQSLILARAEPCRSLSDAQAKCRLFQCLTDSFHACDHRVNQFARDLVYEIAELLDDGPLGSPSSETMTLGGHS